MILPTFEDIQKAHTMLKGVVIETPTVYSPSLSRVTAAEVYLKLENFQETGSFKERGAYVKLKSLSQGDLQRGVIAMSAGNHGQAVAFHAQNLHVPATIVMPLFTPPTKVGNTEKWGARVVLAGQSVDESYQVAREIAGTENLTLIHPYDDPAVIAGQGTIGIEMLESCPELEVLLVPLGGGGLCSGIALAAKALKPQIKIYGVEVEGYAAMSHALYGTVETQKRGATLADGIAVKVPGQLPQMILKDHLEGIIVVTEEEIEHAVDLFARKQNIIAEGAGAVGLSALLHNTALFKEKKVGIVVSGGNIDARIISAIMMRGQIHEGCLTLLRIEINDVPGVLEQVAGIIAHHQSNVIEVKHQRLFYEIPIKMAELDIMIETRGAAHTDLIVKDLEAAGFSVSHLMGGGGDGVRN
ncbi:MAG TPA: threonine ammonia-lyase [Alphaproteobacteria bacterium]|nr:threonine ammonia-lyase [Alphaproteobacteria bacterium]